MATGEDYINMNFGRFVVRSPLGSGMEAEVFRIQNVETERYYAMRLDANDDKMWEGPPVSPPINFSLEAKNARGSWFGVLSYEQPSYIKKGLFASLQKIFGLKRATYSVYVPRIFGVLDCKYLVPVSCPFSLKGAIPIETLLRISTTETIASSRLWLETVRAILSKAQAVEEGRISENEWNGKWSKLARGDLFMRTFRRCIGELCLPEYKIIKILLRIVNISEHDHDLSENIMIRLCVIASNGSASPEVAQRTVRDRFFRENLTLVELEQFLLCWEILGRVETCLDLNASVFSPVLAALQAQPLLPRDDISEFDPVKDEDFNTFIERRYLSRFCLFVQELANVDQPYIALEVAEISS